MGNLTMTVKGLYAHIDPSEVIRDVVYRDLKALRSVKAYAHEDIYLCCWEGFLGVRLKRSPPGDSSITKRNSTDTAMKF